VYIEGGGYHFTEAQQQIRNYDQLAGALYPRTFSCVEKIVMAEGSNMRQLMWLLLARLPALISVKFTPKCKEARLSATIHDIVSRLPEEQPRRRSMPNLTAARGSERGSLLSLPASAARGFLLNLSVAPNRMVHRSRDYRDAIADAGGSDAGGNDGARFYWGVVRTATRTGAFHAANATAEILNGETDIDVSNFLSAVLRLQAITRGRVERRQVGQIRHEIRRCSTSAAEGHPATAASVRDTKEHFEITINDDDDGTNTLSSVAP